ncbi:hypothetical protein [Legionella sp. WA2024007413]
MYSKYPQFFQNEKENSSSGIKFSNVIKTSPDISNLYRGEENLPSVIFGIPTLLMGIFGRVYPEVITIEEIKQHKLTNLSNDFHMVSMSENPQVALDWGQGCFITIDPTLFRTFAVDLHATYRHNNLNLPGRMERETEHVALAVPYCSIKKITINKKEVNNPFYVAISSDNQEAIKEFHGLYCQFVSLLRNKYAQKIDHHDEQLALREYVTAYLEFYAKHSGIDNPFNNTLQKLVELHPEFMGYFFQSNPQEPKADLMKDRAVIASDDLFKKHYYTQSLDELISHRAKEAVTYYDDDWAKPIYD